jgi:hypothetical protein
LNKITFWKLATEGRRLNADMLCEKIYIQIIHYLKIRANPWPQR